MEKDYYKVLGVTRGADDITIKNAYRKLAKKYHPDMNPNDRAGAEKKFKELNEAYDVLKDPEKRKLYDQFGAAPFQSGDPEAWKKYAEAAKNGGFGGFGGGPGSGGFDGQNGAWRYSSFGPNGRSFHFSGKDGNMNDILRDLFDGGFGGASGFTGASGFGGASGIGASDPAAGDVFSDITIDFDQAVRGCDTVIRLRRANGTQALKIHIPAGVDDGGKIRLKGRGNTLLGGGKGDLYLRVHVAPKAGVRRKGADIYTTRYIPFIVACLGGTVKVKTVYGKNISVKIPAGTQSGKTIRLKGMGVRLPGKAAGDQYVAIEIEVPRDLTSAEKQKLREFDRLRRGGQGGAGRSCRRPGSAA